MKLAKKEETKTDSTEQVTSTPSQAISERRSKELVIAFAGPIGSGIVSVKEKMKTILEAAGYDVHIIKISDYLAQCLKDKFVGIQDEISIAGAKRYIQMQDVGNTLRSLQGDILAEYAIRSIAEIRTKKIPEDTELSQFVPERTVYLIDQLKHQDEVNLLRAVYGNLFFLFGVLSATSRREDRLKEEGINSIDLSNLIERDRKQPESFGQQLDKALQLADFFIRNDHANADILEVQIKRFVDLIHGVNGISPTQEEYGMYVAYAAGLRSACLSRQVGASIMNQQGNIISTGRNDVPKAGGGLYGPENESRDARCVKLESPKCHNDFQKNKLKKEIQDIVNLELKKQVDELLQHESVASNDVLVSFLQSAPIRDWSNRIGDTAYKNSRLSSLIEFSRSIHAEMDAIVSLARLGGGSTEGSTLFTYTFPCHNCARHIVAAGITRVYFLEPYEKSLAKDLHWDAVTIDVSQVNNIGATEAAKTIVQFMHFEGVAPRQYLNMFSPAGERKDKSGNAVQVNSRVAGKKIPEYLDDYRQYEVKVVKHLEDVIRELQDKGLSVSHS